MTGYASADDLLADGQLETADVELPSGKRVQVRALTVEEVRSLPDALSIREMVRIGMLQPSLTAEQILTWEKKAPAGDIPAAARKIQQLSGMLRESETLAYKRIRGEAGDGVRSLPDPETGVEDGGGDAPGDAER